jgi:hypothetical protein
LIKKTIITLLVLALAICSFVACAPSPEPSPSPKPSPTPTPKPTPEVPADYYQGEVITLVVPHGAGGGTDSFARVVAQYLGEYIPGNPNIVVNNMPGAATTLGGNFVYNQAKPDGLTLFQGSGISSFQSLLQAEGVEFDYSNMTSILGGAQAEIHVARTEVMQDPTNIVDTTGLVWGYQPMPASITVSWQLGKEILGFESQDVLTYSGGSDTFAALLSGEINAAGFGAQFYNKKVVPYVDDGEMVPVWQSGLLKQGEWERSPALQDVMTFVELHESITGQNPSGQYWDMLAAYMAFYTGLPRQVMLPPGAEKYTPILREAAEKMLADPAAVTDFEKLMGEGAALYAGKEAQQVQDEAVKLAQPHVKSMQEWITAKWGIEFPD